MKMNSDSFGFTPAELRKFRRLKNPYGIQKLLDDMPYHLEDTAWSPRRVLAEQIIALPGRSDFRVGRVAREWLSAAAARF